MNGGPGFRRYGFKALVLRNVVYTLRPVGEANDDRQAKQIAKENAV